MDGPSSSRSTADRTAAWSWVGATTTDADLEKVTSPTLKRSGSRSTKAPAACLAASIRLGATSVACIELETSTATITVARSRGTCTSAVGFAKPTTSRPSMARNAAAGACRRQPGRRGATLSSRARLVKRTAYAERRRCARR